MATAEHKARMKKRRAEQLARAPGFTPVHNERVSKAVEAAALMFQLPPHGLSAAEAHQRAWQHVAKSLPRPRMVRSLRVKPSKSDSPAYRKAISRESPAA